jgi:hypothetical protein
MKKYLDRYLFSRLGLQLLFSVGAIVLFALVGTVVRNWATGEETHDVYSQAFWGFRQITDGGSMADTLDGLDEVAAKGMSGFSAPVVLLVTLASWLVGMVLYGFVAGAVANAFAGRKEKIDAGLVRYRFRDHGLVVGWDFQGASCVRELLGKCRCREVLVVSAVAADKIREDLEAALDGGQMSRVFIYNGQITVDESLLRDAWPELARRIVILGDRNGEDNDGGNLYLERLLRDHIERASASAKDKRPPVKVHLHIANPVLYTHALAVEKDGFSANDDAVDLEVFNYCESWAWRCWSAKDACDGDGDSYLPLRHKQDAERVELFIIGASSMGQAMAYYAMPLLNYGEDRKHCKITIFDESPSGGSFLPEKRALDAMPEVEVVHKRINGGSDEANDIMLAAASAQNTAVTIVIATPGPDAAVRAYAQLANSLRRMDVSILVWQATAAARCPRKPFLQTCGDCAKMRFFGMTDVLPWMDSARQEGGRAVNYFYDVIFNGKGLPEVVDGKFAEGVRLAWDKERAEQLWKQTARWGQWSSINAGDSFKEKSAAFPDCAANADSRLKLMHAEHNRWWTERLLAGWQPCAKPADKAEKAALKAAYLHWDMIPFEQLDTFTQGLDRVAVAAMSVCGFCG